MHSVVVLNSFLLRSPHIDSMNLQSFWRRQRYALSIDSLCWIALVGFSIFTSVSQSTAAAISVEKYSRSDVIPINKREATFNDLLREKHHIQSSAMPASHRPSFAEFLEQRNAVAQLERSTNFECDVSALTDKEQRANEIIMEEKRSLLTIGHANPHLFHPSRHFFDVMDQIRASKLFKILRQMPKGGILHAHDTALVSIDFIVSITYREHLWQCNDTVTNSIVLFKFSRSVPKSEKENHVWHRVSDERDRRGIDRYDAHIRSLFTLRTENPTVAYRDINDVWNKLTSIFILLDPLVLYVPVWRDYYTQTLKEAFEDNVQYVEFRGLLPALYDLDGKNYTKDDSVQMYVDMLKTFKEGHPEFIGSKFIYAPMKNVPDATIQEYLKTMVELESKYPNFIAGFDLVGQEDPSRTLNSLAEQILKLPENIKFFFHAGETNWFGSVDENLVLFIV